MADRAFASNTGHLMASGAADLPDERTPAPFRATPRWRRQLADLRRRRLDVVLLAVVIALAVGALVGRWTAPTIDPSGRAILQTAVMELVLDADTLWISGMDGRPGVAQGLQALRQDDDPTVVREMSEAWLDAYETLLRRMVGIDVPPELRAVQRQFVNAVTLSRDAVEVLLVAAESDDPRVRRELSSEVVRLRTRAEHQSQSARASLSDLAGSDAGVSVLPDLPSLADLR